MKCECGRTIESLNDIEPPVWWPSEIAFVDDLLQKNTKKGVSCKKYVQSCLKVFAITEEGTPQIIEAETIEQGPISIGS